jgi:signal transduction histidine kinase
MAVLWQKHRCVFERLETRLAILTQMFKAECEEEAELMCALTDFLERDPPIREAWLAGDREKLLACSLPRFEEFRSKHRVTHVCFHDLDGACFLRVHNPARFGDTIERHTLREAAKTGRSTQGMELGPFGTFTLRVVRPWQIDGQLAGYIELGKGIEGIPQELKEVLGAEIFLAIDKSHVERAKWGEGLRMTGQSGRWELADRYVFVNQTGEDLPPQIIHRLNTNHPRRDGWEFDFSEGSTTYRCGVVPLVEADGHDVGSILSLLDITESVAAQNRLLALLVGCGVVLACVLGEFFWRYLGWVQREVTHAQEGLQSSLKREQSFTDDVAHELRTLLAGMRSTIDVALRRERDNDELEESLKDCSSIVKSMESLVGKLLMLARLDGGKIAFSEETVSVAELIDDCWEPVRALAATRGLALDNRVPDDLTCVSDRVSLGIVFSNLLENSAAYADENGRIWVTADTRSGDSIHVAVANTGCRLTGAEVALAFQHFWRADRSRGSDGQHSGLGLSLARRLARAVGGDVSADVDEDGVFSVCVVLDGACAPRGSTVRAQKIHT